MQAHEAARKANASLVVAKLDRLAREPELVNRLSKEVSNNCSLGFLFADLPDVDATNAAGPMILGVMAQVAQFEAERIGERTREALTAAKARGVKLVAVEKRRSMQRTHAKEKHSTEQRH